MCIENAAQKMPRIRNIDITINHEVTRERVQWLHGGGISEDGEDVELSVREYLFLNPKRRAGLEFSVREGRTVLSHRSASGLVPCEDVWKACTVTGG